MNEFAARGGVINGGGVIIMTPSFYFQCRLVILSYHFLFKMTWGFIVIIIYLLPIVFLMDCIAIFGALLGALKQVWPYFVMFCIPMWIVTLFVILFVLLLTLIGHNMVFIEFWRQESCGKGHCPVGTISWPVKHNNWISTWKGIKVETERYFPGIKHLINLKNSNNFDLFLDNLLSWMLKVESRLD